MSKGINPYTTSKERDRTIGGLGRVLRQYSRKRHISQRELAEQIGVSETTVREWEANRRRPQSRQIWEMIIKVVGEPAREEMFNPD